MTDFLIRDLDPHVLERLRQHAEDNGRSLQAEIHDTLKRSVRLSKTEWFDLAEKMRAQLPTFADDSTPLIREARDGR